MSSITDKIHNLVISAKMDMHRPTALYLGHQEHKELLEWIRVNIDAITTAPAPSGRLQWAGMTVFEVDAESHIDAGNYAILS